MSTFSSLNLGLLSAGQTRSFRFTVTFPQTAAIPALQAASTTMLLRFSGVTQ
jgi:hypothetical protein